MQNNIIKKINLFVKNLLKNKRIFDFIFVLLVSVIVIIPVLKISKAKESLQEKRTLAEFPKFFIEKRFNEKFCLQFDSWFNDRFYRRNGLINVFYGINYFFNDIYENDKAVYFKKYDIMFDKEHFEPYTYTQQNLERILVGVESFFKFCDSNNIKCYIQVIPEKLYFENDPFFNMYKSRIESFTNVTKFVKDKSGIDIIYSFDQLKQAALKDKLFFLTDHHLTDYGSYIMYRILMNEMKKDFHDLRILPLNKFIETESKLVRAGHDRKDFFIGMTCMLLNLSKKKCDLTTNYKYYDFKDESLKVTFFPETLDKLFRYTKAPNPQRVMIIGNSFTENFVTFLAPSFKEVIKLRSNSPMNPKDLKLSNYRKEIKKYLPDAIVIFIEDKYARDMLGGLAY